MSVLSCRSMLSPTALTAKTFGFPIPNQMFCQGLGDSSPIRGEVKRACGSSVSVFVRTAAGAVTSFKFHTKEGKFVHSARVRMSWS